MFSGAWNLRRNRSDSVVRCRSDDSSRVARLLHGAPLQLDGRDRA